MVTCKGKTNSGTRCRSFKGLFSDGYCRWHTPNNRCCGKKSDGTPCLAVRKPDYKYCCAAHDPNLYYVSPSLFGQDFLRRDKMDEIVEHYDGRDLYTAEKATNLDDYQVDHILEKQCFAFVTVQADITKKSNQKWIADIIRDDIVNNVNNLCFTRTETNKMKGQACFKFLDDIMTGHHKLSSTMDTYLKDELMDGKRLERDVTKNIRKAMGKKIKFSQSRLANEGDTPELERISMELQKLYVDMDLKVRSTY